MWPIKTKSEIHDSYMFEVERIEVEILELDNQLNSIERKKARCQERILQLQETAKLFE